MKQTKEVSASQRLCVSAGNLTHVRKRTQRTHPRSQDAAHYADRTHMTHNVALSCLQNSNSRRDAETQRCCDHETKQRSLCASASLRLCGKLDSSPKTNSAHSSSLRGRRALRGSLPYDPQRGAVLLAEFELPQRRGDAETQRCCEHETNQRILCASASLRET